MRFRRRTHFVDKDVQGALAIRVIVYWAACLWGIFCVLAGFPVFVTSWLAPPGVPSPGEIVADTWSDFWPAMLASLLMLPLLIKDVIRTSNRFVGPFFRLRGAMRKLAEGEPVADIRFRKNDFWYEVAEDFNKIAARVNGQHEAARPADATEQERRPQDEVPGREQAGSERPDDLVGV